MSYISEKVAYLNGLADGMQVENDKYGKLFKGILDAMQAIAEELEEQEMLVDDLSDCVDDLYDAMDECECCDCDECDDDEEDDFLEIVCPACGETIYFDEDMLDGEDGLICPYCNEPVDIDICCDCEDCECDGCGEPCDCGCCDDKE